MGLQRNVMKRRNHALLLKKSLASCHGMVTRSLSHTFSRIGVVKHCRPNFLPWKLFLLLKKRIQRMKVKIKQLDFWLMEFISADEKEGNLGPLTKGIDVLELHGKRLQSMICKL